MPNSIQFNEARGSMEAHVDLAAERVRRAQEDYDRATEKGHQAQAESLLRVLEERKQEYQALLSGPGPKDNQETIH